MESIAIVREMDSMGRLVIPVEIRKILGISVQGPLELYVAEGFIVLRAYNPGCVICGSMEGLKRLRDKNVCEKCIGDFNQYTII